MSRGKISVVIVNWNSGRQLRNAICSIAKVDAGLIGDVIVVDNFSVDDSLSFALTLLDLPFCLKVIENKQNMGFGYACNQGAALCKDDFILFLNPDAMLEAGSLSVPRDYMLKQENWDVGICGVRLIDEVGRVSKSCSRFPKVSMFFLHALGLNKLRFFRGFGHHMEEWEHDKTREVDQLMGAFFLVRKGLFDSLGGFDERFFVYFEEVDFSLRAKQAGWRSIYLADAQAFHAGGGTSRQVKAIRLFYSLRSRLQYGFKHFSKLRAWLLLGITILIEPWSRAVLAILKGGAEDIKNVFAAYRMLFKSLPDLLKGRGR